MFEEREFMSPPEIAEATGKSPDTVRGWIESGELEGFNGGNKVRPRWLVSQENWEAFIKKRSNRKPAGKSSRQRSPKPIKQYV